MPPSDEKILTDDKARLKLKQGINKVADLVGSEFGPFPSHPIRLEENLDPFVSMGARLCLDVGQKTREKTGDGGTTAILLFRSLIESGMQYIQEGNDPFVIKKGLQKGKEYLLQKIDESIFSVKNLKEASFSDEKIDKMIAHYTEQGTKIAVTQSENMGVENLWGLQIDKGYESLPHLFSSHFAREMEKTYVLLTEKMVKEQDFISILSNLKEKNLLIIAKDFTRDLLATLAMNQKQDIANLCAVKIEDSALGEKIADKLDGKWHKEKETISLLGYADKIFITKNKTTFITNKKVDPISLIHLQNEEQKKKWEDGIERVTHIKESGALLGGGVLFLQSALLLQDLSLSRKEMIALEMLFEALLAPVTQLIKNAGYDPFVLMDELLDSSFGFDAKEKKIVDMKKQGIIDPAIVVKEAFSVAVDQASELLLTEILIDNA